MTVILQQLPESFNDMRGSDLLVPLIKKSPLSTQNHYNCTNIYNIFLVL